MPAIAFTHLVVDESDAFEGPLSLKDWVEKHWDESLKRFSECQSLKRVYLFLANAYQAHLVAVNNPNEKIRADLAERREADLRLEVMFRLRDFPHPKKFVIVGLTELLPILASLEELSKNSATVDLKRLFLGNGQNIFYDCPKVVEALIRIACRNEDPNTPIFRFDEDVAVSEEAISALITEYRLQRRRHLYYFFSGNYQFHTPANLANLPSEKNSSPQDMRILHLLNDFSVRTHFLSSNGDSTVYSYLERQGFPTNGEAFAWRSREVLASLNEMRNDSFTLAPELADAFLEIIGNCGASLNNQPISGAGLCISPMAIMQLPPFANVATQIMWIDDDLKRRLHLGIRDLAPSQFGSVREARFEQNRHPDGVTLKDVLWGYSAYLPRVVTGCLMNALLYDPLTTTHGAFAASFERYMSGRTKPGPLDRSAWAQAAIARLEHLRAELCNHRAASNPLWKPLADFAKYELTYDTSRHGIVVESVIQSPEQDITKLCTDNGLPVGRNAGAYVAEVISDLHRYIELVDIWPYIVRTLDFLVRNEPSTHWLKNPPVL